MLTKSMYAKEALDRITAESSRLKKIDLMKEACQLIDGFFDGVRMALDVRFRFNIKMIPVYDKVAFGSPSTLSHRLKEITSICKNEVIGDRAVGFLAKQLSLADTADAAFIELVVMKDLRCCLGKESYMELFPDFMLELPDGSSEPCIADQLYCIEYPVIVHAIPSGIKVVVELNSNGLVMVTTKNKNLDVTNQIANELETVLKIAKQISGGLILDGELVSSSPGALEKYKRGMATNEELDSIKLQVYDVFSYDHYYLNINKKPYNSRLPVVEGLFPRTNVYAIKANLTVVESVFDMRSYVKHMSEINRLFCVRELYQDSYLEVIQLIAPEVASEI